MEINLFSKKHSDPLGACQKACRAARGFPPVIFIFVLNGGGLKGIFLSSPPITVDEVVKSISYSPLAASAERRLRPARGRS